MRTFQTAIGLAMLLALAGCPLPTRITIDLDGGDDANFDVMFDGVSNGPCTTSLMCQNGQYCDSATQHCVDGCDDDSRCAGSPTPHCDTTAHVCAGCTDTNQCGSGQICSGGACTAPCVGGCASGRTCCNATCVDLQSDSSNCGMCGVGCMLAHANSSCIGGGCSITTCAPNSYDINHDPRDGCEYSCTFASAMDAPDPSFVDSNCDGIDGDATSAVFVDGVSGSDANGNGSMAHPYQTISTALLHASAGGAIYVSKGTYAALVLTAAVDIYGGYDAAHGWARAAGNMTVIHGGTLALDINIAAASDPVHVQLFQIESVAATMPGDSSYGVRTQGTASILLENDTIVAGDGATGATGTSGHAPVSTSANGTVGYDGCEGISCPTSIFAICGNGGIGANRICNSVASASGGSGGEAGCGGTGVTSSIGSPGTGGIVQGTGGAAASGCTFTTCASGPCRHPGGRGGDGPSGANGRNGGVGPALGTIVSGLYVASSGGDGGAGGVGTGGGGGGGGSGADGGQAACAYAKGGGGGGGGAGGCAGDGGLGGHSGGGSFGVFVLGANVTITGCVITTGTGGAGGNGGNAVAGTAGTTGATGGANMGTGSVGGRGGDGGDGGNGGNGAGGNGGPSLAIALHGGTVNGPSSTTLTPGAGGTPGTGGVFMTTAGANGNQGTSSQMLSIP